jgi:2-polyprenyl-3-methyl-5-hydroxy-6-metoxy-1,4-benzoquinol methylase
VNHKRPYKIVKGIKCFHPEVADSYDDYPDSGFDVTETLEETSFWVRSRNRLFKSIVYRYLAPSGRTKFLEIGSGNGSFIRQIKDNLQLQITGSEVYLKGLLYSKNKLPDIDFVQFDVTQGIVDDQFDMIVALDVIEHVQDDIAAIGNMSKMLHRGGTLVVSVPQHMFLWSRLDELVKHKRRYSRRELIGKLQQNGFNISYCSSFVFVLFPLLWISRIFDRGTDQPQLAEGEFDKRVRFSKTVNWILDRIMRIDEMLIRFGVSLPVGGTLLVVAQKK